MTRRAKDGLEDPGNRWIVVAIILIAIVTVVAVAGIFWLKRNGDASLRGDAGDARRRLPVVGAILAVTLVALLLITIIPRLSA